MTGTRVIAICALFLASSAICGCAGTDAFLRTPAVELTGVEMSEMSFASQTFLLAFDVSNPNPFPLPVRAVRYRVRLNDQNFAGGESQSNFTIPARGDGSFVISVDLDLMQSGARLTSILRSGMQSRLDYDLQGNLDVDIPTTPSIAFSNSGTIMVRSEMF